ncbi:MAG TPA: hypothetical protein VER96_06655 [Polyangiaceae bacterium]|nr:hypothetical protein [Polyangiaceae bacterium]
MAQRAGLLVQHGGELAFLPASVARWILPLPRLTRVPWDSAQMALVGGEVVAVLPLGEPSGELVLCELDGQAVALSGLYAHRVGFWPSSSTGVEVDGIDIPMLDLSEALKEFRSGRPSTERSAP